MKKIIAILLALAVVSMAFAQTVSISNELSTDPFIEINGGTTYWGFANSNILREQVVGEAVTADGRAKVKGRIRFDIQTLQPTEESILSFKPRWSWNSNANANDGNRSCVAAVLKPWDFLEIGIGNLDEVGYARGAGPNFDWSEWSTWYRWGYNMIPGLVGRWQRASDLVYDGVHVVYTGVPNLWIGAGLSSARNEKNEQGFTERETMLKKGMFNGLSIGAGYDADLFSVGAVWKGNFGMENGTTAETNDKAYQDHTIYASFTFKGLQEAKIGTNLYAAVGFYTAKASKLVNWSGYVGGDKGNALKDADGNLYNASVTSFLFDIGANLNFRNGISDDIAVAVGYYKIAGLTSKVLPFCVRNTINYSASSDATFSFTLGYSQSGLAEKKAVAAASNLQANSVTPASGAITPTTLGGAGWLVFAYPRFSWTMGAHSFNLGVRTTVDGDIVPHAKSGHEWAWTGLKGNKATVDFPLSWTYNF
ncbi:MAG: hypothetical protein J5798_01650 [Spirochaetaceae bacterium]|nr:hypothetical protein [Spirochaetaceae bacterium]